MRQSWKACSDPTSLCKTARPSWRIECICGARFCKPSAQIVAGFRDIMPPFSGEISEEEVNRADCLYPIAQARGDALTRGKLSAAHLYTVHRAGEDPAMSIVLDTPRPMPLPPAGQPARNYLNASRGFASWLLTKDHKRIALLYLFPITAMFFIGAFFIAIVRLNLMTPTGDLVSADTYNKSFTAHGIIMVFFFFVPVVPIVLGNFCLPLMIGAKDLAFPRLNLLSWYLYMFAAIWVLVAILAGGVDTGWTFYTPYSSHSSHYNVVPTMIGVVISGFSSMLTGINFIATVHWLRAPGMRWFRLPIFVWTLYATSFIFLVAVPVLAMALILVIVERVFQIGIYDPAPGR